MNGKALACTRCGTVLAELAGPTSGALVCGTCGAGLHVAAFPALFRPLVAGQPGQAIVLEGEASCFYHPQKRAVVPCQTCGRFLCALCDVELNGQHLCPACLESGQAKGRLTELQKRYTLYDSVALTLAIAPLLFWPLTCLSAPAALYVAVRHWKTPLSILPRTKIRYLLAIVLATVTLVGWGLIIYALVRK